MPVKAPRLNLMEPKRIHGKRAVVETARLLAALERKGRICGHFHCHRHEHLIAQQGARSCARRGLPHDT
jgi:hypothetical protein